MPRPAARRTRKLPTKPKKVEEASKPVEEKELSTAAQSVGGNTAESAPEENVARNPTPEDDGDTQPATKENTPVQRRATSRAPSSAGSIIGRHVIPASANKIQRRGTNIGGAGVGGTTPSVKNFDNSIMSNFKFRPRKPSILHLDDDINLDLDLSSDLNSDVFLDSESIDIGEPEAGDEGTPLKVAKEKDRRLSLSENKPTDEEEPTLVKGTQQEDENIEARSSSPLSSPPESDAEVIPSSPLKLTEENLNRLETVSTHTHGDESVPPPESSSPVRSPLRSSELESQSEKEDEVDIDGEGADTTSKASTSKSQRQQKALADHLSTARLRERLLPQRKRRKLLRERAARKNTFDVISDEESENGADEDENEISYIATTKKAKAKANGRRRKASAKDAPIQAEGKENAKLAGSGTTTRKARRRTYGKPRQEEVEAIEETASAEAEENEADDNTEQQQQTREQSPTSASDELARQKKKFEEIWKWDMEFEDVPENDNDVGTGSSQFR